MTTFQMVISIVTIVISLLTLLGLGVVMKNFWDDKHDEVKASRREAKQKAKEERKEEIREVLREEIKPIQKTLQEISDNTKRLQESMVTIDRIVMKLTLDSYREQGYASASDRAAWNELYNDYRDLGGNHFREYVNEWKRALDALPIKEEIISENKK